MAQLFISPAGLLVAEMFPSRRKFLQFGLKILLAWSVMTALIVFGGNDLLTPMLPLFKTAITLLVSEFSPSLKLVHAIDGGRLELTIWVMKNIPIDAGIVIQKGRVLTSFAHVLHILAPIAVMFSILLVWPVRIWRQKLLLITIGMLFSILILLVTLPVLLLGLVEMPFQEQAMQNNSLYHPPWFMDWMVFSEMGGALLLALVGAFLSIWLQQRLKPD